MPALRSAWRVPHIASAILAYAAFGVAFVLAIMYLIREAADAGQDKGKQKSFWASRLPPADVLDKTIYRTIAFGFLMQTLLVIVGVCLGPGCLGPLLNVGRQRDLVTHHVADLCGIPAHAHDVGMARSQISLAGHYRVCRGGVHPVGSQLPVQGPPAQLRIAGRYGTLFDKH